MSDHAEETWLGSQNIGSCPVYRGYFMSGRMESGRHPVLSATVEEQCALWLIFGAMKSRDEEVDSGPSTGALRSACWRSLIDKLAINREFDPHHVLSRVSAR